MVLYYFVRFISFNRIILDVKKLHWLFTKEALSWLLQSNEISRQAKMFKIEHPCDYLNVNNLGIKMGTIAAFDIRDEQGVSFFEKIW
jgi:hypothetical protein